MSRHIVGITGKKRSGKDTAALYLNKRYQYQIYRFADPIKNMILTLLNHVDSAETHYIEREKEIEIPAIGASYRKLAQTLGTEWGRNHINPNLWVDVIDFNTQYIDKVVVSDVRFDNEAEWVERNSGTLIEIIRNDTLNDKHSSEQGISDSFNRITIHNNGSIRDLEKQLDEIFYSNIQKEMEDVIIDILDGTSKSELIAMTGLPSDRVDEIYNLYDKIHRS